MAQWEKTCGSHHDSPSEKDILIIPPWIVTNSQGNAPSHEVANPVYSPFVESWQKFDLEAATYVNRVRDTALHISTQNTTLFLGKQCKQKFRRFDAKANLFFVKNTLKN